MVPWQPARRHAAERAAVWAPSGGRQAASWVTHAARGCCLTAAASKGPAAGAPAATPAEAAGAAEAARLGPLPRLRLPVLDLARLLLHPARETNRTKQRMSRPAHPAGCRQGQAACAACLRRGGALRGRRTRAPGGRGGSACKQMRGHPPPHLFALLNPRLDLLEGICRRGEGNHAHFPVPGHSQAAGEHPWLGEQAAGPRARAAATLPAQRRRSLSMSLLVASLTS